MFQYSGILTIRLNFNYITIQCDEYSSILTLQLFYCSDTELTSSLSFQAYEPL